MATDRDDGDERQARLDRMLEEFRSAKHQSLVKRRIAVWNRLEAADQAMALIRPVAPEKAH